jgi:hypothetical protein
LLAAALARGEIPTSDCQGCAELSELSPEKMAALRDNVVTRTTPSSDTMPTRSFTCTVSGEMTSLVMRRDHDCR